MRRQVILPDIYSVGNDSQTALAIEGKYSGPSIEVGELVIDYAENNEKLFIRNSAGALIPFMCSKSVMNEIEATSGNIISFIVNDAPDSFDTFKEISDWIQAHSGETISIIEDIATLSGKVATAYAVITENEYIVAQTLNDLNRKIRSVDNDLSDLSEDVTNISSAVTNLYEIVEENSAATTSAIQEVKEEIFSAITENEYIVAQTLNDLNRKIRTVDNELSSTTANFSSAITNINNFIENSAATNSDLDDAIGDINQLRDDIEELSGSVYNTVESVEIDETTGEVDIKYKNGDEVNKKIGYYLSIKTTSGECTSVGDGYLDEDGYLYTFNGNGFDRTVKMVGEDGPQGPQGLEGPQGPEGVDGAQGPQGNGIASITYTRNESPELWSGKTGGEITIMETGSEVPRSVRIYDGERGPQGIAPQLRVTEDGNVEISYDGTTWVTLGTARFEEGATNNYYSTNFKPSTAQCDTLGDVAIDPSDGHIYEYDGTQLVDTGISLIGPQGYQGQAGTDVSSILISDVTGGKQITIGLSNGTNSAFTLTNGIDGQDGVSVSRLDISRNTSAVTYITYLSNGEHSGFTVYDGTDGITPQIEVRADGDVYVSYDNGTSWNNVGTAHFQEGATNTYNTYSLNLKANAAACTQNGDAYIDNNGVLQILIDGDFIPSATLIGPRGISITSITTARTGSAVTLTTIMSDGTTSAVTLSDGVGIASVTGTSIDGSHAKQTLTITKTNGETASFDYYNGTDGKNGRSIAGISGTVITGNDISVNIAYDDETPTSSFIIPHGLSAYEIWLQSNPGGTREQFFTSITGDQGPQGPDGIQGPQGPTGANGTNGADGSQGPQGPAGNNGTNGTNGIDGAQGPQGPLGYQGPQGPSGSNGLNATGVQGPQGPKGLDGDGKVGDQGPQGPAGSNGTNGADGSQGPQGPTGANGSNGSQGPQGPAGSNGTNGVNGSQGPQGPAGSNGTNGTDGSQGPQGPAGSNGTNGADGSQGPQGPAGSNGANGSQGPQGPAGSNGTNGINGNQGPQGPKGANGGSGPSGSDGNQGPQGPKGSNGGSGPSGSDGNQGPQGPKGETGPSGVASFTLTQNSSKSYLLGVNTGNTTFSSDTVRYSNSVWYDSGELYASSDERLKNFIKDVEVDFDELEKIPKKYFSWKNGPQGVSIGTSAQKLADVYPEVVSYDNDIYGVSYERLSIIALAAIDKLHKENEELKERVKKLEEKLGL